MSAHTRPALPSGAELAQLPPDGGPHFNRLVFEQSPYLRQHAANPVDWWPWGDAAFEQARRDNKPVFLSIGYATCHWCHVMEHESFEDDAVARLLNEHMIPVKVDREERPDIDHVYMTVTQALTGQGGWPMTVILTPDRQPFFAGTYFPRQGSYGRPGMTELISALAEAWRSQRDKVVESAREITAHLAQLTAGHPGDEPGEEAARAAFDHFDELYDESWGGFSGGRNKFPVPHNLLFLTRYAARTGSERALQMVTGTLRSMRLGGIFDQIGFGFHRYSTDSVWLLPHFEKMLYDQALHVLAYLEAARATGDSAFERVAREVVTYVTRDLQQPDGGIHSAEDADSEGVEGKFTVWTPAQVLEVLGEDDARLFCDVFHIIEGGNFHEEATGHKTGESIPHLRKPLADFALEHGMDDAALAERLEPLRAHLFAAREQREHPFRDDKILTDWNGLMLAALARAARQLGDNAILDSARRCADFLLNTLRTPEGRWLKRARGTEAGLPGHLEDYAFVLWGFLEMAEATGESRWLIEALATADTMIELFADDAGGGFFMTAHDGEVLLVRPKDAYDGAIPSGNAVAALCLARLARITGKTDYRDRAGATVRAFAESLCRAPTGHAVLLLALEELLHGGEELVLAGSGPEADAMHRVALAGYCPHRIVLHRPPDGDPLLDRLPDLAARVAVDGRATAYVCRAGVCSLPVHTAADLERLLAAGAQPLA